MRISSYKFSPSLVPTLVTFVLLPLLVSLGFWQLDRADEKRTIEAKIHELERKTPLELNKESGASEQTLLSQVYRSVIVKGRYDGRHQFLYDNRTYLGKPGYHVLTPFVMEGTDKVVLVNRGWIPYLGRRDDIPDISLEDRQRMITGRIKAPGQSIVLDDTSQLDSGFPKVVQSLSLGAMGAELQYEILPVVIELDKSVEDGFIREWQPYYGSIEKHNGYAAQWFVMAAVLLFLYLKYNLKKEKLEK